MAWCLVANTGLLHILRPDLMLIGRENCDISIQSRSVDKRHSVIAFDKLDGSHSIKDVGSLNGTFVNDSRIPDETYIVLKKGDTVRFGYDPITYRFDSLQLDNISVVKDQEGSVKQAFLSRQKPPDYNISVQRAMQQRHAREAKNTYNQQTSFQDNRSLSHGSPLYGQPAWWGEHEDPTPDGSASPDHLKQRQRSNTSSTQGSSEENRPLDSSSPVERPVRLAASQVEPERDIPIHIYSRKASDLRPSATPPPKSSPQAEVTLMAANEKSIGFTIEFGNGADNGGGGSGGPKMARRPDSLQNCIPENVRQKIERSSRMMEELKAERLMKRSLEEETQQSPRASPLTARHDGWTGGSAGRKTPKQNTPETPSPGYQDYSKPDPFQQQRRNNNKGSSCLSEPLPASNIRQRTFVKSSQKTRPPPRGSPGSGSGGRGPPSPISPQIPISPGTESDPHFDQEVEVEVDVVEGETGEGGDDLSETGTYTIESDTQSKEVIEAREKIDQVFGVEGENHDEDFDNGNVEKIPSDDDTDKDIGDEEIEDDENVDVFSGKQNGQVGGGVGKRQEGVLGTRVRGDGSSRTRVDKIEDVEAKQQHGGPGTPQWVQQWATMTTKSSPQHQPASPERHHHPSPDRQSPNDRLLSPDRQLASHDRMDGYEGQQRDDRLSKKPPSAPRSQSSTKSTPAPSIQSSDSSPRDSRGKRILPSVPNKAHSTRQSSSSSEQTMRQNGFQASNSSAFRSPRNGVTHQQQQPQQDGQYQQQGGSMDRTMEQKVFEQMTRRKLHGSSDPILPRGYHEQQQDQQQQQQQKQQQRRDSRDSRDSWEPEGGLDTDDLLKDTETLMRNLEERMQRKRHDTPSPEMSDSQEVMPHDISQDMLAVSFEADVDTDVDTTSNVSFGGNNTWGGSKSRHMSCPEDNDTSEQLHYSNGRQKTPRSVEKSRTSQAEPQSRSSSKPAAPAPKSGGIWSRLSTPNKHKMPSLDKSANMDTVSDSEFTFKRNTHLTGSLPTGRIGGRSMPKGHSDAPKKTTKPKSLKPPSISQPRQTRSTMLRKNRFSEDSGADHSDISPSSSMSDLSSSKNFRRGGSMRETRSGAMSDSGRRTPVETRSRGRGPTATHRNGDSRNDQSLGSQIARHARTQSIQDQRLKAGEPRTKPSATNAQNRSSTGGLVRKSSLGSADVNASAARKTTTGGWRRYDGGQEESEPDVDSYIKKVRSRGGAPQNEERPSLDVQRQKSSSLQNLQSSGQPRAAQGKKAPNLRVEIAQASNTLAQNLQRLAQGETIDEIQMERIPKEQQMMDEFLSEDSVHLSRQDIWQGEKRQPQLPLQRSSSLSFQLDQNSHGILPLGSPTVNVKKKPWNKSESQDQQFVSFDSLVLSSIHHLSIKMKDSADKVAYKLKKLQQPGANEEELSRVLRDSDFPLLKTNNKEVAGILQNLRKMEKRLEEINNMVDPRNEIRLPEQLSPVNQMRRQYVSEFNYGTVSDSESPRSVTSGTATPRGRMGVNNSSPQRHRHSHPHQQQHQQQFHEQVEEEEYYL